MENAQGYVSVYKIIEEVLNIFDTTDIEFSVFVDHIADALLFIGSFDHYIVKTEKVDIKQHRGELPCDIIYINQIRSGEYALRQASHSFHPDERSSNFTYRISGDHIFTDFKEGSIEINYRAMPLDDDGFPLIPDNVRFRNAVKYHVLYQIAQKLFYIGKITGNVYKDIEQNRDWYIGSAQSRVPTPDQMESLSNKYCRLISNSLSHSRFFKDSDKPEIFKRTP